MDQHWFDDEFGVLKIDMKNAFNLVSRQVLLSEYAKHFPELFPWSAGVMANTLYFGTPWVA